MPEDMTVPKVARRTSNLLLAGILNILPPLTPPHIWLPSGMTWEAQIAGFASRPPESVSRGRAVESEISKLLWGWDSLVKRLHRSSGHTLD